MNYGPQEFGMRIMKMRKELGKTQQEIADELHTSLDNYRGIKKAGGILHSTCWSHCLTHLMQP